MRVQKGVEDNKDYIGILSLLVGYFRIFFPLSQITGGAWVKDEYKSDSDARMFGIH